MLNKFLDIVRRLAQWHAQLITLNMMTTGLFQNNQESSSSIINTSEAFNLLPETFNDPLKNPLATLKTTNMFNTFQTTTSNLKDFEKPNNLDIEDLPLDLSASSKKSFKYECKNYTKKNNIVGSITNGTPVVCSENFKSIQTATTTKLKKDKYEIPTKG